jgi:hypothetical protein
MTATTPARPPYARIPPTDNSEPPQTLTEVDRELKKIERQQQGLYQPKVITHARSPYTIAGTDYLILADATAGAVSVVFPAAARVDGMHVTIVKVDVSANAVTLSGTFNGVVNPSLGAQYAAITIDAGSGVYYGGLAFTGFPSFTTTGVTNAAKTIIPVPTVGEQGIVWISGDDGGGNTFVDSIVYRWGGTANTFALTSTNTQGAPPTRFYNPSLGALQITMGAAGTFTVVATLMTLQ